MTKLAVATAALIGMVSFPVAARSAQPPLVRPTSVASAPDYAVDAAWLCLPTRAGPCTPQIPVTPLGPQGFGPPRPVISAADAPVDCFYVYPTVSRDPGLNSDLVPGPTEEQGAALVQFSPFSAVCRPFAPMYRSVTLSGIPAAVRGQDVRPVFDLAYGDVRNAWRQFLASRSNGRPFVLVGHSQGSIHLQRLIQEEIEGRPIARQMVSAIIPGWNVEVPRNRLVGGTFRSTPLCSRRAQTGCVVSYVTFRAETPPPPGAQFGRADVPNFGRPPRRNMTVGCVNPATLTRGPAPLRSLWFAPQFAGERPPITWSSSGTARTPWLATDGLVSGECINRGPLGYLAISVNADPADPRTDRVPGDTVMDGQLNPGWGLHSADMAFGQRDLVQLVADQSRAFARRR